ncbi:hypothetical protein, partial [Streptomyces yanii]|uniref:hypothetical protein n=1 Tax=Streptomyces yanii TaxID=78510 RepID=UPI0036D86F60
LSQWITAWPSLHHATGRDPPAWRHTVDYGFSGDRVQPPFIGPSGTEAFDVLSGCLNGDLAKRSSRCLREGELGVRLILAGVLDAAGCDLKLRTAGVDPLVVLRIQLFPHDLNL